MNGELIDQYEDLAATKLAALRARHAEALSVIRDTVRNQHKPGWHGQSLAYLRRRLSDELAEFDEALATGTAADVLGEAADVCNFIMMLADCAGALDPAKQEADHG